MSDSKEERVKIWNLDQKKLSYDFFKHIATLSVSIVAFFGGFTKLANPTGEFTTNFISGMYILGMVVFLCFLAMILHVYSIGSLDNRLTFSGAILLYVISGFVIGLSLLLTDLQGETNVSIIFILWIGVTLIGTIGIMIYLKIKEDIKRRKNHK